MSTLVEVLARAAVVLEGDDQALQDMLKEAERRMIVAGEELSRLGKTLTARVTLPLTALGTLAVHAFAEQEEAIARMSGVLTATGGAAGVTADHVKTLADQLQDVTTFSDGVTISASAMLLTLGNVRNVAGANNDVFDRAIKLSQDLAALTGGDLQSSMFMLGRALEDPATGLTMLQRRTRALSEEQIKQIKSLMDQGRVLDAQKIILAALEARLGGLAATMAKTPTGRFKQAWNEINTALEGVGEIIATVLLPLVDVVKSLAKWFQQWSDSAKIAAVGVAALAAAMGPLLVMVGLLMKMTFTWTTAMFAMTGTIGLVGAAIISLVAAGVAVANHWIWLKQQAVSLWAFIKNVFFTGLDAVLSIVEKLQFLPNRLGGAIGRLAATMRVTLAAAAEESMARSGRAIAGLEAQLMSAGVAATETAAVIAKTPDKTPRGLSQLQQTMNDFAVSLSRIEAMEHLLGAQYDETAERATAYATVVDQLIAQGVGFDQVIGANGETLRMLATRMLAYRAEVAGAAAAQQAYSEQMNIARSAVEATLTPMDRYNRIVSALQEAVADGVITWDQYVAAVRKAKDALKKVDEMSQALEQAIADIAGRALDSFVDFAFGAQQSFSEFIRTALADLAKLILKMQLMKLLFPKGQEGGLFAGLFAQGGFLSPGQLGIAGEAGPELIAGGRHGVTVTPALRVGGVEDRGPPVTMIWNVNANDAQSVARFFEANENLVAGAALRALQRSRALSEIL